MEPISLPGAWDTCIEWHSSFRMKITSRHDGRSTGTAGRTGWRRSVTNESGDRELVAAFLSLSDEASFRSLYRAHTPGLYRLALRVLGGRGPDAEEVVQATWIRAVEGLRFFRWQSSLRTWLAGIALNCCREVLRQGIRER